MRKHKTVLEAVTYLLENRHGKNDRFIVQEVRPGTLRFGTGMTQLTDDQHIDFDTQQRKHPRGKFGMLAVIGGRGDYGSVLWLEDHGGMFLAAWTGIP